MIRGFLHIIPYQNSLDQSEDQEVTKGRVNRSKHSRTNSTIRVLSRREVSARQDAMTYLVRVRELLSGW